MGHMIGFGIIVAIAVAVAYVGHNENIESSAKRTASGVCIDGIPQDVHILSDKATGRQWRYVHIDRGALIIPGSEQGIPMEAKP